MAADDGRAGDTLASTIPQFFYDVIGRVFPGFFLLMGACLVSIGTGIHLPKWLIQPGQNSVASLLYGAGFGIVCYFFGWVLRGLSLEDVLKPLTHSRRGYFERLGKLLKLAFTHVRTGHFAHLGKVLKLALRDYQADAHVKKDAGGSQRPSSLSVSDQYNWIRLMNPSAGFRIVKLRAEARMAKSTRTAMLIVAGLGFLQWPLRFESFGLRFGWKIAIPLLLGCTFRHIEWLTCNRYRKSIESHYKLMSKPDVVQQAGCSGPAPLQDHGDKATLEGETPNGSGRSLPLL